METQEQKLQRMCKDIDDFLKISNSTGPSGIVNTRKYYADYNLLMGALEYIEKLGFVTVIHPYTCNIFHKDKINILIRKDTKKWAIFYAIHKFVENFKKIEKIN